MATLQIPGEQIGASVSEALSDAGRNKLWLSEQTGIPRTTLNRKMLGRQSEFTMTELLAVAEALGVAPSRFTPPAFVPQVTDSERSAAA